MSGNESTPAPDPNPTVVRLDPADRRIEPGTETTIDAIVQRIDDDGVGVYDLTVTVDGPATINSARAGGDPVESLTTTEIAEDRKEAHMNAISTTVDGTGHESIVSLSIRGKEDGDSHATFSVDVRTLGTEAGDTYDLQQEIGADVLVRPRGRGNE